MAVELSPEDMAIMESEVEGVDPSLLDEEKKNSATVKKFRGIGFILLAKANLNSADSSKFSSATKAKAF